NIRSGETFSVERRQVGVNQKQKDQGKRRLNSGQRLRTTKIVQSALGLFEDLCQTLFTLGVSGCPFGSFKRSFNQGSEWTEEGERFRSCRFSPVTPALGSFPDPFYSFLFPFEF